jgi:acetyl-CoA synthetase
MGRLLPGYRIRLAEDGEICVDLAARTAGLMTAYAGEAEMTTGAQRGGQYHTGDIAEREEEGYFTYIGRADDVFKASDYRISPFELESALVEHPAIAEAAVVPSPDPLRTAVPKAFVILATGYTPCAELAREIFVFTRRSLSPYKRIRRLEFSESAQDHSGRFGGPNCGGLKQAERPERVRGNSSKKISRIFVKGTPDRFAGRARSSRLTAVLPSRCWGFEVLRAASAPTSSSDRRL